MSKKKTNNLLVGQHCIDVFEPVQRRIVWRACQCVEVRNHIVAVHDWIQEIDQIEERLLQINILRREPLATEYDHRSAQSIKAALIQTSDATDFTQVLCLCTFQQLFVPVTKWKGKP